jgi:hypothetical protein
MERGKAVPAALRANLVGDLVRLLKVATTLDQLYAECAHRRILFGAVTEWDDDGSPHAVFLCCEAD